MMLASGMHNQTHGLDSAPAVDARKLTRLLLYGRPASRQKVAESLARGHDTDSVRLLADTVRAPGPWLLRARCLEALGAIAGSADQRTCELVLEALVSPTPPESTWAHTARETLSRREREISDHVAHGLNNAQIAAKLGLSERTVENHVSRALAKLGLASRTQLAVHLKSVGAAGSTMSQPSG
jgi:DNA-binding CsgD family transcriptional regulator